MIGGELSRTVEEPGRRFGATDSHLFHEGTHRALHEKLGAHPTKRDGRSGTSFAVWAPNAGAVSVIGDFNGWEKSGDPLQRSAVDRSIWEGWIAGVGDGARYKFHVVSGDGAWRADKADPFAVAGERAPETASIVREPAYIWHDAAWMKSRGTSNALAAPISIYEVHVGSWRREPARPREAAGFREIAHELADYARDLGFTHVELMPVMEHPFYGSWGYEITGFFAPSARYGTPEDLMFLVDTLHAAGIGVILDWVPSHFPEDEHGLVYFDGTHLYSHPDRRRGWHPDWKTRLFDFERREVWSFLLSSAFAWLERYHADGLRVDAVASMLHLDFGRQAGEWLPNEDGGRENHAAAGFLRELNRSVYERFPEVQMIAEDSTLWPGSTRPVDAGGLGFGLKWDLGWMHDMRDYLALDPLDRAGRHDLLTFRGMYSHDENYLLPLGHDEVVYGKRSLLARTSGDDWQRHANLRLLFAAQFAQSGKKLVFMGGEIAEPEEWWHERGLDWSRLLEPAPAGVQHWVRALNRLYRAEPALHDQDYEPAGLEWLVVDDALQSVTVHLRRGRAGDEILIACNFTPVPRERYRVGVPESSKWTLALDSDAREYGGSGFGAAAEVSAATHASHGRPFSIELRLPPLAALFLKRVEVPR